MDQVTLVKNQYRLEQWTRLIQDCQSSGMRVDDWCEANGVTHHAYYYWLRKVRKAACQNLSVTSEMEASTHFKQLEVQAPTANTQAAVIIHLPSATLEIQNGTTCFLSRGFPQKNRQNSPLSPGEFPNFSVKHFITAILLYFQ